MVFFITIPRNIATYTHFKKILQLCMIIFLITQHPMFDEQLDLLESLLGGIQQPINMSTNTKGLTQKKNDHSRHEQQQKE